jgi:hypothetical protein
VSDEVGRLERTWQHAMTGTIQGNLHHSFRPRTWEPLIRRHGEQYWSASLHAIREMTPFHGRRGRVSDARPTEVWTEGQNGGQKWTGRLSPQPGARAGNDQQGDSVLTLKHGGNWTPLLWAGRRAQGQGKTRAGRLGVTLGGAQTESCGGSWPASRG